MKREFLKDLKLEKEVIDKIMAEHGKSVKSSEKLEEIEAENQELKDQLEERKKDLKELEKGSKDAEKITKQLDDMKVKYEKQENEYKEQMQTLKNDRALDTHLAKTKVRGGNAPKALKNLLDPAKLVYNDDGTITGFDDQIKALQESDSYLFDLGKSKQGYEPKSGNGDGNEKPKTFGEAIKAQYEKSKSD